MTPRPGWQDLVVLCATAPYDSMPMGDWHLARELSALAPVLFVDPPMSRLTPRRNPEAAGALARPRLTVAAPGIARLTPVVQPGPSRRGLVVVSSGLTRRFLRQAIARLGGSARAVISGWPQYPAFGACGEQVSVYWAKDDFVGGAHLFGESARLLAARERRVAAAADLIVAANPTVAATWRGRGLEPVLIPFGTDAGAYAGVDNMPPPPDVRLPAPVAGFVGRLNSRTDLGLLERIAASGMSLLIVGPMDAAFEPARFAALTRLPHVSYVGPKPFAALPRYMRLIDVGLVPYRDTAFNRGSFPLKTLEYLAAGRAVVSTDLPATRWLGTDLVSIASSQADFAALALRLAREPRTPAIVARRREFAAAHSWTCRARQIHDEIIGRCVAQSALSW